MEKNQRVETKTLLLYIFILFGLIYYSVYFLVLLSIPSNTQIANYKIFQLGFALLSIFDLFVVELFFMKRGKEEQNYDKSISFFLISLILITSLGIYGVLLGILKPSPLGSIDSIIVLSFISLSFLLTFYYLFFRIKPSLAEKK